MTTMTTTSNRSATSMNAVVESIPPTYPTGTKAADLKVGDEVWGWPSIHPRGGSGLPAGRGVVTRAGAVSADIKFDADGKVYGPTACSNGDYLDMVTRTRVLQPLVLTEEQMRAVATAQRAFGINGWIDVLQEQAEDALYAGKVRGYIEGILKKLEDGRQWPEIAGDLRGLAKVIERDLAGADVQGGVAA